MLNNKTSDNRTVCMFLVCDCTLFPKFPLLRFFKNVLHKFKGKKQFNSDQVIHNRSYSGHVSETVPRV